MKITVQSIQGNQVGELELADGLMVGSKGAQAAFDAVRNIRAAARAGTASTKTKGEVAGTGAKPWKQKGTGRARAGYRRSPVWRGGGVAFGPKPRSYAVKMNRKSAQLAFKHAFGDRLTTGQVRVLDELTLAEPRTREFAGLMKTLGVERGALFILAQKDDAVLRASRNIPKVEVTTAQLVNVYQLVRWQQVVITRAAFEELADRLA